MFDELKVFIAVAETRSFTKAAMLLNFSQPAISQQIKKLEIFFQNTPLVLRSVNSRQIELTEEGQLVYQYGKEIMERFDNLFSELGRQRHAALHPLRIGASMTIGNHLLPSLIARMREANPDVVPKLFIANSRQICDQLDRGEIDMGLIEGKTMYYDFKRTDFFTDPLILVASPDVAEDFSKFSPSNLSKASWIVREYGSGTAQYLQAFLESNHILIENRIECNSNEAICEMVKSGLGITFISQLAINRELRLGELVRLPMNREYVRKFSLIEAVHGSNPMVCQFAQILKSLSQWYSWE